MCSYLNRWQWHITQLVDNRRIKKDVSDHLNTSVDVHNILWWKSHVHIKLPSINTNQLFLLVSENLKYFQVTTQNSVPLLIGLLITQAGTVAQMFQSVSMFRCSPSQLSAPPLVVLLGLEVVTRVAVILGLILLIILSTLNTSVCTNSSSSSRSCHSSTRSTNTVAALVRTAVVLMELGTVL